MLHFINHTLLTVKEGLQVRVGCDFPKEEIGACNPGPKKDRVFTGNVEKSPSEYGRNQCLAVNNFLHQNQPLCEHSDLVEQQDYRARSSGDCAFGEDTEK